MSDIPCVLSISYCSCLVQSKTYEPTGNRDLEIAPTLPSGIFIGSYYGSSIAFAIHSFEGSLSGPTIALIIHSLDPSLFTRLISFDRTLHTVLFKQVLICFAGLSVLAAPLLPEFPETDSALPLQTSLPSHWAIGYRCE